MKATPVVASATAAIVATTRDDERLGEDRIQAAL
jgi:hypothetical protein